MDTLLANSERVMAICAVADTIKPSSAQAVADLKSLGVTPVMLTGDNIATARTVGSLAGIKSLTTAELCRFHTFRKSPATYAATRNFTFQSRCRCWGTTWLPGRMALKCGKVLISSNFAHFACE